MINPTDKSEKFKKIAETVINVIKIYSTNAQKEIDKKFKVQLANSIYLLAHIYTLLNSVANHPKQREITDEVFESQIIIWQANNTMLGAIQLIRQGYPLEPQFLMRVAIESFALAVSFHLGNGAYSKYKKGDLSGKECINSAKKIIKEIGQIYGLLSTVTHPSNKSTGNNYNPQSGSLIIGGGYTEKLSHRTLFNFSLLNYLLLTIWKGSELIFYEFEDTPMFWYRKDNSLILRLNSFIKLMVAKIRQDFENAIRAVDKKTYKKVLGRTAQ